MAQTGRSSGTVKIRMLTPPETFPAFPTFPETEPG